METSMQENRSNLRMAKSESGQELKIEDFSYLALHDYKILKEVGRGGYGVVYKASQPYSKNSFCAIKINFNTISRELIYAEMAFLMLVKGDPRLPNLLNLFIHNECAHIVIQYFKFKPFITFYKTICLEEVRHYLYQLLLGLKSLKSMGIYHRDIKPANFLYNPSTKRGMIVDFGLAEIDPTFLYSLQCKLDNLKDQASPQVPELEKRIKKYKKLSECLKIIGKNKIGTESYMPLESLLHHHEQTYESDIWPVGVTFLQLISRRNIIFNTTKKLKKPEGLKSSFYFSYLIELATFYGVEPVQRQCRKLNFEVKLPAVQRKKFKQISEIEGYDDIADNLLQRMLCLDYKKRITVEEALEHPFFDSVRNQH